jgi:hypothetical protein
MVDNINANSCKRNNYILSEAIATKLNRGITPYLFGIIRSGNLPLNNDRNDQGGCFVEKQLNYRRYKN